MTRNDLNLPNALSGLRLLLAPVLLWLAAHDQHHVFLAVLVFALATDAADGYLARRLNQASALGAKLDSWGDLFIYGTMVVALLWLWPDIFAREKWFLGFAILSHLVPTATSLVKFRELPRYHTWAAKIAAVLMAPAYFLLVLFDISLLFRLVVVFHIWVALEEVIITFTLKRTRPDVPTLFHARELVRRQRELLRQRRSDRRARRRNRRRGEDPPPPP